MKFVKQHSWEQEWADTLRQEKAYLQKNLHKKDSALNRTLEERIPDTLQDTLDDAFSKAFALIFEKGTGVIEQTYNKKRKAALFQTHCAAVRKQGDRRTLHVFLTPQGTLRMEQVTQAFQVLEDQAFQGIPPAQRATFLQTLQKVYDNLGKEAAAL